MPYPDFLGLVSDAAIVVTDWGAIREETMISGAACQTLHQNTDSPASIAEKDEWLVHVTTTDILGNHSELKA